MTTPDYSEFRYGKLLGQEASGYRLVARTADLTDEAALAVAVQTYSFWGARPPAGQRWAIGLVPKFNGLMLIKKEPAKDPHGNLITSAHKGFDLMRCVIVPAADVKEVIAAQNFRLLDWMFQEPIPVQAAIDLNLNSPSIPLIDKSSASLSVSDSSDMLYRSLQITTQEGQSLLLQVLSALLLGKRLLFGVEKAALELWKSLLLLLPASCRSEVAIAMGTVSESACNWAHIIVKIGETSAYNRPDDLLLVNPNARKIEGEWSDSSASLRYVELLKSLFQSFEKTPENVGELLSLLDAASKTSLSLRQLAADLPQDLELSIIKLFPAPQRSVYLDRYFSLLSEQAWRMALPLLNESNEVASAWAQLQHKVQHRVPDSIPTVMPLMSELWPRLSAQTQAAFLNDLSLLRHPDVVTAWIETVLQGHPDLVMAEPPVTQAWVSLCRKFVNDRAHQDPSAALAVAKKLDDYGAFAVGDRFWLFDAVLSDKIDSHLATLIFTQYLAPLLAQVSGLEKSSLCRYWTTTDNRVSQILKRIGPHEISPLAELPLLATLTNLPVAQHDSFYFSFLQVLNPTFEQSQGLLKTLAEQGLLAATNVQDKPPALTQTLAWFKKQKAELDAVLADIQQGLPNWSRLMQFAALFEGRLESQMSYADHLVAHYSWAELNAPAIGDWLDCVRLGKIESSAFQGGSQLWKAAQLEDIKAIALSQPQLVGTLLRELIVAKHFDRVGGILLQQLARQWEAGEQIDESLLPLIDNTAVIETYSGEDWLLIARICWLPDIIGWPQKRPRALDLQSKKELIRQAKYIVQTYNEPQWVERLLKDCESWHLSLEEQREILEVAPPKVCSAAFIGQYINAEEGRFDLSQERSIRLLLATDPRTPEDRQVYKQILVYAFLQEMASRSQFAWLKDKSAIFDQPLCKEAVCTAAEIRAAHHLQSQALRNDYIFLSAHSPDSAESIADAMSKPLMTMIKQSLSYTV